MEKAGKGYKQCSIKYVEEEKRKVIPMAVIMELNGGKIRIHDDSMVKTKEENDKIIERVSQIMINAELRRMKEQEKEQGKIETV